jgi:hypothetical protein
MLAGRPEGKSPVGRTKRMWVDNIKIDPWESGCIGMDLIDLAQNGLGIKYTVF